MVICSAAQSRTWETTGQLGPSKHQQTSHGPLLGLHYRAPLCLSPPSLDARLPTLPLVPCPLLLGANTPDFRAIPKHDHGPAGMYDFDEGEDLSLQVLQSTLTEALTLLPQQTDPVQHPVLAWPDHCLHSGHEILPRNVRKRLGERPREGCGQCTS